MKQILLLIGTRKGGFLAFSNLERKNWQVKGPVFKGVEVNHVHYFDGAKPRIVAAGNNVWWGPGMQISTDWGENWHQ